MFSRSSVFVIGGLLLSSLCFAGSDERKPFSKFLIGEYTIVDETSPVLKKRADGSLELAEPKQVEGLVISASDEPYTYKVSFEGDRAKNDLIVDPTMGQFKITDFDTVEIKSIKFGNLVVTHWSNSQTGWSLDLVVKDTVSPYTPGKGLSLFSPVGDDVKVYLVKKPKPVIRVDFKDRATLYPNLDLSCTEIASIVCRDGADAWERVYCGRDVEKECQEARDESAK